MLLIAATAIFSQQTNPAPTLTKQDFLQKRKKQLTACYILAGTGITLSMVSLSITAKNLEGVFDPNTINISENNRTADILGYTGLGLMAASIPFFISAGKNKKKAATLSLKNEKCSQLQKSSIVYKNIPSLTLKINL